MPLSREETVNQAGWALSRYHALRQSHNAQDKINSQCELIVSRFWQEVALDGSNDQEIFDTSIQEWKAYCDSNPSSQFLAIEPRVQDIARKLSVDTSSYDAIVKALPDEEIPRVLYPRELREMNPELYTEPKEEATETTTEASPTVQASKGKK